MDASYSIAAIQLIAVIIFLVAWLMVARKSVKGLVWLIVVAMTIASVATVIRVSRWWNNKQETENISQR